MTTEPQGLQEIFRQAEELSDDAIHSAWQSTEGVHKPTWPMDALTNLMERCEARHGYGCLATESPKRAWLLIWAVLRRVAERDDRAFGARDNLYQDIVDMPASLPDLLDLVEWAQRFEGLAGENASFTCNFCDREIMSYRAILAEVMELHREQHRNAVRGAVLGLAAGDHNGCITDTVVKMAKARQSLSEKAPEAIVHQYQQWIESCEFNSKAAGFSGTPNSSVGACLAAVVALDPLVATQRHAEELSADLARHVECDALGINAAIVSVVELRHCINKRWPKAQGPEPDAEPSLAENIPPEHAALLGSGSPPEGVKSLPRKPEFFRTTAFQNYSDDVRYVIRAARHFDDISMHVHTALGRVFEWCNGPHPVGILAGFRAGAKHGGVSIDEALFSHLDPDRLLAIKDAANILARLWVGDEARMDAVV
jgi:hypothetical protein